jgi:hypothetical protein
MRWPRWEPVKKRIRARSFPEQGAAFLGGGQITFARFSAGRDFGRRINSPFLLVSFRVFRGQKKRRLNPGTR